MSKGESRTRTRRGPRERVTVLRFVFAFVAATVLLLAWSLLTRAPPPASTAGASGVIEVLADMGGFDVDTIRVKAGEPVMIRLTSLDGPYHLDGGGRHQLAIDELGVDVIAPPRGSASAAFVPARPGSYVFYCDICCGGRANPTMSGTLIVESA